MTTTSPPGSTLTIECAKPDCSWRGSPADAPTHPCPTPAHSEMNEIVNKSTPESAADARAEGQFETSGSAPSNEVEETEAQEDADRVSFAQQRAELEVRLDDAGVSYSKDLGLDELKGLAQLLVDEPAPARQPEPTLGEPDVASNSASESASTEPAYDFEPETLDEHAAWLAAHGAYDAKGVPSDERTATLDARYGVLLAEAGEAVDDGQADEPEVVHPEPADAVMPNQHVRPWQTVIAAALAQQGSVPAYKWLVVFHPADTTLEATLMARGKTKNEAAIAADDMTARGTLIGEVAVVKTADVLKAADEQATFDPGDALDTDQEESDAAPPAEKEAATVEEAPVADPLADAAETLTNAVAATIDRGLTQQGEKTLFDVAEYDDPSLALPGVDGRGIERIAIAFTGEVMLDRADKDHVALFKRLKLGQTVELWVEARGLGFAAKGATNKDGELDVVVAKRTISVQHVRVLGPEDLQEAALEVASQARDAAEAQDARDRRPDGV